ncbi:MAG: glycosyltransferase family 4 protein [Flavobacteriales bacterium]
MKAAKHILIFMPGFPENESDDTCMPYLQTYLREASKAEYGLRFTVVSLQYPYKSDSYKWRGIPVFSCGGSNRSFPFRFYYWRKALKRISQVHQEQSIDVIHSFWLSECTLLAQRWAGRNGVNHIATAMGQDVLKSNRYLQRINLQKLSMVAVSEFQNNVLKKSTGTVASDVIPWGMNELPEQATVRNIDILGVGSLTTLKAYDSFLRVVAEVAKTHPNVQVILIGDGPERSKLESLVRGLGIGSNVQFLGGLPHKEVLNHMQRAKVLLHTSTYESQGFVFNEAHACGMSIVSTQVGLAKESARWIVCKTEEEIVEGIESLLPQAFETKALIPVKETADRYRDLYCQA